MKQVIRVTLLLSFFIFECASAQIEDRDRITNYEARSNLQPGHAVGCADLPNLTNAYSPAELYPAARKCIDKKHYETAARLFSMAGAYGYYDTMRVDYEGAPHAIRYIQILSFQDVGKRKMKNFNHLLATEFATGTRSHTQLCRDLQKIGPPAYHPDYLIQHGMRSDLTSERNAMRAEFDSNQAWQQTLTRYLRCLVGD
ncbi:MAG: hypothetical protein V3T39_05420 [Gammaproteobacteria bacterium]